MQPSTAEQEDIIDAALRLARGYADGGSATPYDYAEGAAGLANKYALGIPATLAGYASGLGAAMTGRDPRPAYFDVQGSASRAADLGAELYGRDTAAMALDNPVGSGVRHAADNIMQNIILTLPMAMRMPKRMLHPDDMGGADRMRKVADDFNTHVPRTEDDLLPRLNDAWQNHGVSFIPGGEPGKLQFFTTFETPGTRGITDRNKLHFDEDLGKFYDNPALYAINPEAAKLNARVVISPSDTSRGSFLPYAIPRPRVNVAATGHDVANSVLDHELTHVNASRPNFNLPQGSNPYDQPSYLPAGTSTGALDAIRARISLIYDMQNQDKKMSALRSLAIADELEQLEMHSLPGAKRFANYVGAEQVPGEFLARMEQLFKHERKEGRNPFAKPIIGYDDLDLSAPMASPSYDLRKHRIYKKDE